MRQFDNPLQNVRIANPCSADWQSMYGTDAVRFCGECKLNVYNLSGMSLQDAERLLWSSEGRLCVRYFRRQDGTIITKDCPVGLARYKERSRVIAKALISMIVTFFSGVFFASLQSRPGSSVADIPTVIEITGEPIMGAVAPKNYKKGGRDN